MIFFLLDKKRVYDTYGVDGLKSNGRNNFQNRNSHFSSGFCHNRDPFDLFKSFFGSSDAFNRKTMFNDPFENFFQNHSNLHRGFFQTPFHSAPNVFDFSPLFSRKVPGSEKRNEERREERREGEEKREGARKCSVETKTGADGTVHITKTIIDQVTETDLSQIDKYFHLLSRTGV